MLTRSSTRDCELIFFVGRGFAELQILKKWKWPCLLNWVEYCNEILHTHWYWHDVAHEIVKWHLGLVRVLPRFKFWKKVKLAHFLNLLVYFDKILHIHYYWHDLDRGIAKSSPRDSKMTLNIGWQDWQDVPHEIVKCHLKLAEALLRFKFWKNSETGPISWNFLNISIKLCIYYCCWRELDRGIAKYHLSPVEAMPRSKS